MSPYGPRRFYCPGLCFKRLGWKIMSYANFGGIGTNSARQTPHNPTRTPAVGLSQLCTVTCQTGRMIVPGPCEPNNPSVNKPHWHLDPYSRNTCGPKHRTTRMPRMLIARRHGREKSKERPQINMKGSKHTLLIKENHDNIFHTSC